MRSVPSEEVGGRATPVRLGKYAVLGAIGRGGMADVYLAMAHGPSSVRKLVVVKCMRAGNEVDGTLSRMFMDEGRLAALLNHVNVVHTYEVGHGEDGPYIVMEYLHGQALSAIARVAKPLAPRLAARVAADALTGLHYAHELRDLDGSPLSIVHRDLSPPNIFVTHDGVVKLVDFGIAKTAIATRASTEAGLVKGKLAYMAPEQATGGAVDRRADLYAMGVVLWELLTGRRLVEDLSPASIVRRALQGTAPRVSSVRADVEPALCRIVERALQRDPEARYATALEMREALDEVLAHGTATGPRELSGLMAEHFSEQRLQRERQIQAWVAAFTPARAAALALEAHNESARLELEIEEVSSLKKSATRELRSSLLARSRIIPGALVAGGVALGLGALVLHSAGAPSSDRDSAATLASSVARATPQRNDAESASGPALALAVAPPAILGASSQASTKRPLPAPPRSARSSPPRPLRSGGEGASVVAPETPSSATAPARTPPNPRTSPALERNPYMHSE